MSEKITLPRYQDFVIKDGKLVGDFEGLYKNFDDPWHQSRVDHMEDSRRQLAIMWVRRLHGEYEATRAVELGCGLGHLTQSLQREGIATVGMDISQTAIERARIANPSGVFVQGAIKDFSTIEQFDPDIFIMA